MMRPVTQQANHTLVFETHGSGFTDITRDLARWLEDARAGDGLLTVFVAHTSASLTIQENADPDVLRDLADALERVAPRGHPYRHNSEGSDDMPAHIKSMVTSTSLPIPVLEGRMTLGTWQSVYLVEHRDAPHRRRVVLTFIGTSKN
ncbi:MAG: secondary thiamine-phosphate synthase enzyme YjbQ [Alphaproteobacteria bacterium]